MGRPKRTAIKAAKKAPPLRFRVPNPPPIFVGRDAELERLCAAVARGPLTVLWGLGGLGKTALVAELFRRHFEADLARAVMIAMRPGDSITQLEVEALHALAPAFAGSVQHEWHVDVPAALIDLAERDGRIVVLEDLHHGAFDDVRALLAAIARYARRSRWIVATREDPMLPELAEQVIALGAMRYADLRTLATSIGGASVPDGIVRNACGSPWRLRQLVGGARLDSDSDLLAELSPTAQRLLDHMVELDLPLPTELLGAISPLPEPTELALLERRGMIERSAGGLRLHDVTRAILSTRPSRRDRAAIARTLTGTGDPSALIEAARLGLEAGDIATAEQLLRRHHRELAAAGFAPRLWHLLETSHDAGLVGVKRHVALAAGSASALAWAVALDRPDRLDDQLAWVRALSLRVDIPRILAAASKLVVVARDARDDLITFEATLLLARAYYTGGQPAEGVAILRACATADPVCAARRDAMLARCLSAVGDHRGAIALAEPLERRLDLPAFAHREVQQQRAVVLIAAGWFRAASAALGDADGSLAASPRAVLRNLHLAVECGELTRGHELFQSIARFPALLPIERMHSLTIGSRLHVAAGEFELAARQIDEALTSALNDGAARIYYWARVSRVHYATVACVELGNHPSLDGMPEPDEVTAVWLATFERAYALRRGQRVVAPRMPEIANLEVLAQLADAEEALHDGDPASALDGVHAALRLAREHGLVLLEADGLQLAAELAAVLGRFDDVARDARSLAALAETMPSPRYAAEARFLAALADDAPDLSALRSLADAKHAPQAARRARNLLGLPVKLDALDALVVHAASMRWQHVELARLDAVAPADWAIDLVRREVHLENGDVVSLRRYPVLLELLAACAASNGPVTKEQLAQQIWRVKAYHPHRDDARIEMAISRLRKLLDTGGRFEHLVTAGDAYAVLRPCWVLRPATARVGPS
jgi:hypothetical protein